MNSKFNVGSESGTVNRLPWVALALALGALGPRCEALPSFARQMNMSCTACHTAFPELTAMGRQFKLAGYTLSTGQTELPPIAVMLQPSFTNTAQAQDGGAAPGFKPNNNFALTQASFFYAGRLLGPYASAVMSPDLAAVFNKIGIFSQTTYHGVAKDWSWDNTEIRYADTGSIGARGVAYGVYANNNPTLQDPWNSTPAWGYPFSGSGLAPGPAAKTQLDGSFAQQVAGAGAYLMIDNTLYLDLAAYHTIGAGLQKSLGVDPAGEAQISGAAPYWRLALEKPLGPGTIEVGTLGMATETYPGRDPSAGHDRILDLGFDSQYQTAWGKNDLSATLLLIHEREDWGASQPLGNSAAREDNLTSTRLSVHYLWNKTYGLSAQRFDIRGSSDALLYSGSRLGSPKSDGAVFEADFLPLNLGDGPKFWPRSNVKFSVQYIAYGRFDGSRTNYDGSGRNARDNNTLYFEAWLAF